MTLTMYACIRRDNPVATMAYHKREQMSIILEVKAAENHITQ